MPAAGNQYQSYTFGAGILSASLRNTTADIRRQAASNIKNFEITRDGAVKSRPGMLRGENPTLLSNPLYSALPTTGTLMQVAGWQVRDSQGNTAGSTLDVSPLPDDGEMPVDRVITIPATGDLATGNVEFTLGPGRKRGIVLHGTILLQGNSLVGEELVFRAEARIRGQFDYTPLIPADTQDQYAIGAFTPGIARRDVTLVFPRPNGQDEDWDQVRIRAVQDEAAVPMSFHISGISAWTRDTTTQPINAHRRDFRHISWAIQEQPHRLVIGMDTVWMFHKSPGRQPELLTFVKTHLFTPRQLREMTVTSLGNSILLVYHDFSMPLKVTPPLAGSPFASISRHIPQQDDVDDESLLQDAAVDIRTRSGIENIGIGSVGLVEDITATAGRLEIPVSWTPQAYATAYTLYWITRNDYDPEDPDWSVSATAVPNITGSIYTIENLQAGTEYGVSVRAHLTDDKGTNTDGPLAAPVFATPLGAKLADVENVVIAPSTEQDGYGELDWDAVSGATRYEVQVSTIAEASYRTLADDVTDTEYTVPGLPGWIYDLRVRAHGAFDAVSDWSEPVRYTAMSVEPEAPTALQAIDGDDDGEIVISWTASVARNGIIPDGYDVLVDDTRVGGTGSTTTIFRYIGQVGTTYNIKVRAYRGIGGQATVSPAISTIHTAAAQPPAMPVLTIRANTATGVNTLVWSAVRGATAYEWEYGNLAGSFGNRVSVSTLSVTHNGTPGQEYQYRVRAVKAVGTLPVLYSAWSVVTTEPNAIPVAPDVVRGIVNARTRSITWNWDAVPNAVRYEVVVTVGSSTTTIETTDTSYTHMEPSVERTIGISVTSINRSGARGGTGTDTYTFSRPETTQAPEIPQRARVAALGNIVRVQWEAGPMNGLNTPIGYAVGYREDSRGFVPEDFHSTGQTRYDIRGLAPGNLYRIIVAAYNGVGNSDWVHLSIQL